MADDILTKFPMKKKREPKIVVFEEPKKTKQVNRDMLLKQRKRKLDNPDNKEDDGDEDFVSVAREVKEFGVTGFTKKEQKRNKQSYAEYLGARKLKNQKVPYPILMERRKKQREKEVKKRELEQAMGIYKKKDKGEQDNVSKKLNLGHWVDKSNAVGKLSKRDVSMHIKKSEIFKVQRTKK